MYGGVPHQERREVQHHLIISGTGRSGTTFLMQLMTALGMDTGFADPWDDRFANCDAGMEFDFLGPWNHYLVKSPRLCDYLDEAISTRHIVVDHAIIPVRNLHAAAQSRRDVEERSDRREPSGVIAGGLWLTSDPGDQERVLERQIYSLLSALAKHDIPTTLLWFPRLVRDLPYLYSRLHPILDGVTYDAFAAAFLSVSRPELVHDFTSSPGG